MIAGAAGFTYTPAGKPRHQFFLFDGYVKHLVDLMASRIQGTRRAFPPDIPSLENRQEGIRLCSRPESLSVAISLPDRPAPVLPYPYILCSLAKLCSVFDVFSEDISRRDMRDVIFFNYFSSLGAFSCPEALI